MNVKAVDRIEAILTGRWTAFPVFVVILYIIFWVTFAVGQYPMEWIDWLVVKFGEFVGAFMKDGWFKDLVVDGIIAGVGSVLVFLPTIMILYFFISIMEDSGYMARAAFIVDKLMHRIGLHGKSFIPMVMGFGCNVPAIMATRTIESRKARLVTIAVIPFMSCAGRLSVLVLVAGAFFPDHAALALLGIYLIGVVLAILSAIVLSRFVKDDGAATVMEPEPLRIPKGKTVWRHTWGEGKQYLQKMATTILLFSVLIWFLGYFPRSEGSPAEQQEQSLIGRLGKAVSPALDPLGFDWRMDVGLLAGVGAKELVVSTMGVMYSQSEEDAVAEGDASDEADGSIAVADPDSDDTQLQAALKRSVSKAAALAFMVFVLLYFPCIATFVAIKNETGGWRWPILCAIYTILVAWLLAFAAYRIGLLIWP